MKKKGLLVGVSALAIAGLTTALTSCGKTATYTVKFYDGTTEYDSKTVTSGYNVEVPVAPTSDGKIFNGWYSDEALTTPFDFGSIVEKDTQVYAAWVNRYSVTFKDGDSVLKTEKVTSGQNVQLPETPTKTDRAFNGWYLDKAFKQPYDFGSIVTGDVTLYASFVSTTDPKTEFRATFMVDGEVVDSELTFHQKLEDIPTPQVSGKTFLGWWVSDYQDSTKLTYQYKTDMELTQDVILFAVFADNKPIVSVNGNTISWDNKGVGKEYAINIKRADIEDADAIYSRRVSTTSLTYDFTALPAGNYVVEVTCGDYTGRTYINNKALDRVNLFVDDFKLSWNKVEGATNYKITVDNGNEAYAVKSLSLGDVNEYEFDKIPMTAAGITFTVVAEAEGYGSSTNTYVLQRKLSNATVTYDDKNEALTWAAVEGAEMYKVVVSSNGKTTNYFVEDASFSLADYTGEVSYSVIPYANGYYSQATSGTCSKAVLATPTNVRLVDGYTIAWDAVEGANGYNLKIGNAVRTVLTNTYELAADERTIQNLSVQVQALATDAANNSAFTEGFAIDLEKVNSIEFSAGVLSWSPVVGVNNYAVIVDNEEAVFTAGSSMKLVLESGTHTLKVVAADAEGNYDATKIKSLDVKVYNLIFDTNGAEILDNVAYVVGEAIELPTIEYPGYTFTGWYKEKGNYVTNEFTDLYFENSADVTIYAGWLGNDFTATLDYGVYGTGDITTVDVVFGSKYTLPAPVSNDPYKAFGGWFSRPDGQGEQYTDEFGNSLLNWRDYQNVTIYAGWLDVFTFNEISNGEEYSVSKGRGTDLVTTITIPTTFNNKPITTVEATAFQDCSNLVEINIPNTIKLIAVGSEGPNGVSSCFKGCSKLQRVNIYEVEGAIAEDVVYSSIDGVLIYKNPFTNYVELAYVPYFTKAGIYTIPSGVTAIPTKTFASCSKLTEIVVPSSVEYIGEAAFSSCSNLIAITFEESTEGEEIKELKMEKKAFSGNSKLVDLSLPARIAQFDSETIESCSALANVHIVGKYANALYTSIDGVVTTIDKTTIIYCPRGRVGSYVTPVGVTTIKKNAFASCSKLTEITISGQVTEIEESAFKSCYNVTSLFFNGVSNDAPLAIRTNAFYGCSSLTEVILPANLVTLEIYAFGGTSKLTKVTVLSSNPDISFANNAFATSGTTNNFYVTDLEIGRSVSTLEFAGVFGPKLQKVEVNTSNPNYTSVDGVLYNKDVTTVVYYPSGREGTYSLPNTVTTIGARVFESKDAITNIVFNKNIVLIGEGAFKSCKSLTSIEFEEGGTAELTIQDSAFYQCTALTTIVLPERLVYIGNNAFEQCNGATSISLPNSVEYIGDYAFASCAKLTEIVLPANLKELFETQKVASSSSDYYADNRARSHAFYNCTKLANISIAETNENYKTVDGILYRIVKEDGVYQGLAAMVCPRGKTGAVTLPADLIDVYDYAFEYTTLTSITFQDSEKPITTGRSIFYYGYMESVTLPKGLVSLETYTFYYCNYLTSIVIPNTVEKIEGRAIYSCSKVESITFEEGGTKPLDIEGYYKADSSGSYGSTTYAGLLYNNKKIKKIVLPERTRKIGDYAFASYFENHGGTTGDYQLCALEEIVIPSGVTEIGKYAFYRVPLKNLSFAEQGESITIKDYAFYYTSIEELNLPARVTTLSKDAFAYNSYMTKLTIAEGLDEIPTYAFYNCNKLSEVTIPASVKTIGTYAFKDDKSLEKVTFVENTQLTKILQNAFEGCKALKEITIPQTVKLIDSSVFSGCTALEKITFAGSDTEEGCALEEIRYYAFANTGLKTFSFPYVGKKLVNGTEVYNTLTLKAAGNKDLNLFQNCKYLTDVYISEAVVTIEKLFAKCSSIERITIAENNAHFKTAEGSPVILSKDGLEILYAYGRISNLNLPESATKIGAYAFAGQTDIVSLVIPKTVKSIGDYAFQNCVSIKTLTFEVGSVIDIIPQYCFYNCRNIETLVIPNSVKVINKAAFEGCTSLKTVKFSENLETIGDEAFAQTHSLEKIELPQSLTKLGDYAFRYSGIQEAFVPGSLKIIGGSTSPTSYGYVFYSCTNLKKVILDEGITQINNYCFEYCSALEEVVIPSTVVKTGNYLFAYCDSLKKVEFKGNITTFGTYMFANDSALTEVIFNNNMTILGNDTFQNCTALESIVLPEKLATMGTYLFDGCSSLKDVTLPANLGYISQYAFRNCTSLVSIAIPSKVKNFGATSATGTVSATAASYSFAGCTALANVEFADTTAFTSIGTYAFQNCTSLKTINLPASTTTIGNYAFIGSGLESITIPDKVTQLGTATSTGYVFQNCANLKSVNFGSGVSKIYGYTFAGCTSLEEVVIPDKVTEMGGYVFDGCSSLSKVTLPANLTYIANYMFRNCTSLTEITIPAKVTQIGGTASTTSITATTTSYVFYGCTALEKVTFAQGSKLTKMGAYTFYGCTALDGITLPTSMTLIGNNSFYGCTALTSIVIPNNVASLGSAAGTGSVFYGCTALEKVTLGTGTKNIYGYSFYNCTSLKTINCDNVTLVGTYAFRNCSSLESINLPKATSLGQGAFEYTALKSFNIGKNVTTINGGAFNTLSDLNLTSASSDFMIYENVAVVNTGTGTIVSVFNIPEGFEVVIPDTVKAISSYAFMDTKNLKKVVLPNTITILPTYSFFNCKNLEEVVLGDAVEDISSYVFQNCTKLTTINFPSTLIYIRAKAFDNTAIVEAILPEGITTLADAFAGLTTLETVSIPASLTSKSTSLSTGIFKGCTNLKNVTLTEGLLNLGGNWFEGCTSLESIVLPSTLEAKFNATNVFKNCTSLKNVTISEGVTTLPNYTFQGCSALESIKLPSTLLTIGNYCFEGTAISSIEFPAELNKIGDYAFQGTGFEEVVLPASVTTVGQYAFAKSPNLKSVTLSPIKTVTATNNFCYAFAECPLLETINIPDGFELSSYLYGKHMFDSCVSIKEAILPGSMTYVPDSMFINCTGLEKVVLGEGILEVYYSAFESCTALSDITLPDSLNIMRYNALAYCTSIKKIVIPVNCDISAASNKTTFTGWTSEQQICTTLSLFDITGFWDQTISNSSYYGYWSYSDATFVFEYVESENQSGSQE